jgi:ankyrin repeat protein
MIDYLLSKGVDINATDCENGNTALHELTYDDDYLDLYNYLVSKGADTKAVNDFGYTPSELSEINFSNGHSNMHI